MHAPAPTFDTEGTAWRCPAEADSDRCEVLTGEFQLPDIHLRVL